MIKITGDIKNSAYYQLIHYLLNKCDILTFHIPTDYQQCTATNNIEWIIRWFIRYYIDEYIDFKYVGETLDTKVEIKVIKFSKILTGAITAFPGLYYWKYPDSPEDLCFYLNGKCFLKSVAQKKLCYIYDDTKETFSAIEKIGLKFEKCPHNEKEVPRLREESIKKLEITNRKIDEIKTFLMDIGVSSETAENDALIMERYISEETYESFKK